ncbi:MAG: protein phosphatase 2C domain-containing protein [Treponema sp.]|jgi:serine/threonine protein phosphatase PrpC|nr:protein phosphatase 2C domain-containing protein [Treponema sp.]
MSPYRSFAHTVKGISHEKYGKECQDASFKYDAADMSIAVVSDGHGDSNCFRSAKGAELSAACAARGMSDFVKYFNEPIEKQDVLQKVRLKKTILRKNEFSKEQAEKCLRERLMRDGIIRAWYKFVADHLFTFPVTEEELKGVGEKYYSQYSKSEKLHHAYGTTLIAAAITEDFWFGIHIGDGRLTVLYTDGTYDQPVPWDEKCYLNVTTSICDDDAYERARCYFSFHKEKQPPVAVFLCTDGIDDNYPVDSNEKHLFTLYRTIAVTFAEDGFESTCSQLKDLANSFATKGKGDDTSIAVLIDMDAVKKAVPVWKAQITEEEANNNEEVK